MFAVLEFHDYISILAIVVFYGYLSSLWDTILLNYVRAKWGNRDASATSDAARLRRLEAKVDLVFRHLELEYKEPATPGGLSEDVKALADDPAKKIAAIKLHREQTGLGLKEAKDAVEAYIQSLQGGH
jgi:hypothetical protein